MKKAILSLLLLLALALPAAIAAEEGATNVFRPNLAVTVDLGGPVVYYDGRGSFAVLPFPNLGTEFRFSEWVFAGFYCTGLLKGGGEWPMPVLVPSFGLGFGNPANGLAFSAAFSFLSEFRYLNLWLHIWDFRIGLQTEIFPQPIPFSVLEFGWSFRLNSQESPRNNNSSETNDKASVNSFQKHFAIIGNLGTIGFAFPVDGYDSRIHFVPTGGVIQLGLEWRFSESFFAGAILQPSIVPAIIEWGFGNPLSGWGISLGGGFMPYQPDWCYDLSLTFHWMDLRIGLNVVKTSIILLPTLFLGWSFRL